MRRSGALIGVLLLAWAGAGAQAPDRSRAPTPGPPPEFRVPPIARRVLRNGLPVWIVERHDVPVAQVALVIRAGAGADPVGRFGLASFTSAMLDEGAGARSALELADAIDYLGASLRSGVSMDASTVQLHVPVARLRDALQLMADVALRPAFPEPEMERVRKQRLIALAQLRDDPDALAQIALARVVFGPQHRYGMPETGTAGSLAHLTVADLRDFHRRVYVPALSLLVVVGDVNAESVMPLLEETFGRWAGTAPSLPQLTDAPPLRRREIVIVDKPRAAQSAITIGGVGVARSTPDFFALTALNTVLGGSFTSRLNQNLRETHGYSYGAFSAFEMRAAAGPFFAASAVQTDRTAEAVREVFRELEGMLTPAPEDELRRAVGYVALGFPGAFATTRGIAGQLETQFTYRLPDDFFDTFVESILAVTPADVQAAARRYVRPDALAVIVVGDRQAIEPGLRALNMGPVRVLALDDVLGRAGVTATTR